MKSSLPDKSIAKKHGISERELVQIYRNMFDFIKSKIVVLDLGNITEDEFYAERTSFMIPGIGKLGTDFKRIEYLRNKNKEARDERSKAKENKADVCVYSDDCGEIL